MMSFNDFIQKDKLRNKTTINRKIFDVLKNIGLDSKVRIDSRDGKFPTLYGVLNLHRSKGTHWFCFIEDCYSESYGFPPPKKILIT